MKIRCLFGYHRMGKVETVKELGQPLQFKQRCQHCNYEIWINAGASFFVSPGLRYGALLNSIVKEREL